MSSTLVRIDLRRIDDWESFHDVFAEVMGFPDFYGRNLNAWIDCMTSLDNPDDGMTTIHAAPGGVLTLALENAAEFSERCPELYEALVDCVAFVNYRRIEVGDEPVLVLSYHK